jgi:rfaE bifunctional protein nucleotidyltransferase chain/domain
MDYTTAIQSKILDRGTALEKLVHGWKFFSQKIVFTNGCFDLLHFGHLSYLAEAASLGNHLVIGLNSDASVSRLKGPERPRVPQAERAFALAALRFVSAVVIFEEDTPLELIQEINPHIITKGGDYGWSYREGKNTFVLRNEPDPEGAQFIDPIHQYDHATGLSITGGYIYQGKALPEHTGAYIYGDFVMGKVWALRTDDSGKVTSDTLLYTSPQEAPTEGTKKPTVFFKPTAFCPDKNGELLLLCWNGKIYRATK